MAAMLMTPYLSRWMMLKAYDADSDGEDKQYEGIIYVPSSPRFISDSNRKGRQNWVIGETIWYFFSIYLAIAALFILFFKDDRKFELFTKSSELSWIFENSECVIWALIIVVLIGHILCYLNEIICNFIPKCLCQFITSKKNDKAKKRKKDETKGEDNLGKSVMLWGWWFSVLSSFVPLFILIAIEAQTESFDDTNQIILLAGFYILVMMTNGIYVYSFTT
jgi:hypothetical protein